MSLQASCTSSLQ